MRPKRKVIVTGGAGFIGSHCVDRLLKLGCEVTVIDNLVAGNKNHLKGHEGNPDFKFLQIDVADFDKIEPHFRNVDWVIHLAARADIVPSIEEPLTYYRANVDGSVSVLEASRKNNVKRFLYVASASCYGIPNKFPTQETDPIRPMYPYALTKYLGELCTLHWGKVYHLPVLSLRLANVYGPRARTSGAYGAVFGVFLAQKYHQKPFTVVGDGNQSRDFIFVSDVIDAFLMAMKSNLEQEILNVGSGKTYSINRLVELLKGEKIFLPKRPGEPDCTHSDISKIKNLLHWSPKVSFEEGVGCMLKDIENWKTAPLWTKESIEKATQTWFRYLGE